MKNLHLIAPLLFMLIANASALEVTRFDIDDPTNNGGTSSTQSGWIAAPGGNGTDGTYTLATTGGGPPGPGPLMKAEAKRTCGRISCSAAPPARTSPPW